MVSTLGGEPGAVPSLDARTKGNRICSNERFESDNSSVSEGGRRPPGGTSNDPSGVQRNSGPCFISSAFYFYFSVLIITHIA